ncbi:MAG: DUF2191 domain-containing protein [Burkholderiales bacterium]|nr:DUF2191 domain-containing protein [Burkholderiales bacterium]
MKTTLDLDAHLVAQAEKLAQAQGRTLAQLVEQTLQTRLGEAARQAADPPSLPVQAGRGGLRSGIDPCSNRALLDAADGDA